MVCIAAFIILCIIGIFVAFLSIFKRDIGRKYWAVFKKSWGCVGKHVRLQKCETGFKDDVKNALLGKVVLSHPTWVKPLGMAIEVSAILIVFITIWSLIEAIKALLAIWVFGTCNVSQPASCALGAEVCGIDAKEPTNVIEWTGRWFDEWGQIFTNIPDKFHNWRAEDYVEGETLPLATEIGDFVEGHDLVLEIVDPGCSICQQSYRNMLSSGFFEQYNTLMMVYPITLPDGGYKFDNSDVIARYIHACDLADTDYAAKILHRIFAEADQNGLNYQTAFLAISNNEAGQLIEKWLKEWGAKDTEIKQIRNHTTSAEVDEIMAKINQIVEDQIHVKGIPTMLKDGDKKSGLYKAKE